MSGVPHYKLDSAAWHMWQLYLRLNKQKQKRDDTCWVSWTYDKMASLPFDKEALETYENHVGGVFEDVTLPHALRIAFDTCDNCKLRRKEHLPDGQCVFAPTKYRRDGPMYSNLIKIRV